MATPRDIYSTLNQDLFFERYLFNEHVAGALPGALPGLVPVPGQRWFRSNVEPYSPSFMMQPVADPRTQGQLQHHINVIKLHGSVNWRSPGGRNVMVIGTEKTATISRMPLLSWYMELSVTARRMNAAHGFAISANAGASGICS